MAKQNLPFQPVLVPVLRQEGDALPQDEPGSGQSALATRRKQKAREKGYLETSYHGEDDAKEI